jgi:hypothetical protein
MKVLGCLAVLLLALVVPAVAQETVVSSASANLCAPKDPLCLYVNLQVTPAGGFVTYVLRTSGSSPKVLAEGNSEPLDSSSYTLGTQDAVVIHPKFMVFWDARWPRSATTLEQRLTTAEYVPDTQMIDTTMTETFKTTKAADMGARVNGKSLSPCWGCGEMATTHTRIQKTTAPFQQ